MSTRDCLSFLWHSTAHKGHAWSVSYDEATNVVTRDACGQRWGQSRQRCVACGRERRWYRHISALSGRCAKCVARGRR
jgi:hypothetical protein